MVQLAENDFLKGLKNQEQNTINVKENKNYAEFDSLKPKEEIMKQEQPEEQKKSNFLIEYFKNIYRRLTGQKTTLKPLLSIRYKPNNNDSIENETENKEQEQENTTKKQQESKIQDFDVFAKKENKEQENKLEEKQTEKKSFFQKIFSPKSKDIVKNEEKKEETLITPSSVNSEAMVVHNPKVQEVVQSQELVVAPIPETILKIQNRINRLFKLDVFDDIDNFIANLNQKSEEAKKKQSESNDKKGKPYFIEPLEMKKIATIFAHEDKLSNENKDNVMTTCIQYLSNGGIDVDSAKSSIIMSYTVTNNKAVQQSIANAVIDSFTNLQMSNTMIVESLASSVLPAVMDKGGPLATFAEKVIIGANPQDLLENNIDLGMLKKTQIYRKNPDIHRVVNYTSLDSNSPIIEEIESKPLSNNGPIVEEIESRPILQPTQQTVFPQIKDIDNSKPLSNNGPIVEEIESRPILQPTQQTVFPQIKDIEPQNGIKKPEIFNEPLEIQDDIVKPLNKGKGLQAISALNTKEDSINRSSVSALNQKEKKQDMQR